MNLAKIFNNVVNIAERAQAAGVFKLQETKDVNATIEALGHYAEFEQKQIEQENAAREAAKAPVEKAPTKTPTEGSSTKVKDLKTH